GSHLLGRLVRRVRGAGGRTRRRRLIAGRLRLRTTAAVADLRLRAAATAATLAVTRLELLAALRALDDRVAHALRDELDRANRVVVARDHVVDEIRIAVRVGDGDDRDAELLRLAHRDRL